MAPAVDPHGNLSPHVSGPRSLTSRRRFHNLFPPPWPGSFWDEASVLFTYLGEGAFGGVPLSIASELSKSSDEDCSVRDLAGLQKVWLRLKYYAMMSLDA